MRVTLLSAVLRFCGSAVLRFCGSAVLRFCGSAVLRVITIISLLFFTMSAPVYAMWDRNDPPRFAGDVLIYAIPLTGLAMTAYHSDWEGAKQLGLTMGVEMATTEVLKRTFDFTPLGERPNGGRLSFPSGHASAACAGATFIGQRYGWRYGSMAMLPAAYVGWSRVYAKAHHVYDVMAGCAVGVLSGLLFTQPEQSPQIMPWYENQALGIRFRSTW